MSALSPSTGIGPQWRPDRSIRATLITVVMGVTLPLVALLTLLAWNAISTESARIRRDTVDEVRERASDLEGFFQGWSQTLNVLASTPALRNKRPEEASDMFANIVQSYPYLLNVAAIDRDFVVWASAVPQIRGVTISGRNRERLRELIETRQDGLSEPISFTGGAAGPPRTFVFLWQPILDIAGETAGWIQIGLPLDTLHTALRLDALTPGRPVLIVHANGTVMTASEDQTSWVGRNIADTPLGRGLRGTQGVIEYRDDDGVDLLAGYQRAPRVPWYAVVAGPQAEAFATIRPVAAGIVSAVVAVTLVALLLGRALSVQVTRPVHELVEAASRLSNGDLAFRVRTAGESELGRVGAAFNRMATDLQAVYADLELRVANRTAELSAAQRDLETLNAGLQARVADQIHMIERASHLKRYLSPTLAEHLVSEDGHVTERTRRRNLSVLFADIRGFTSFSEEVEPEEVIDLLNGLLSELTAVIFEHQGTLDKYLGDGLMAFFGDPIPTPDHAERAVKAAIAMRERATQLQAKWFAAGHAPLGIGTGIASGFVTVGTIGASNRLEYTVIGNNVNLASRLSDQAAAGEILVTTRTLGSVRSFVDWRSRGEVPIKGRTRPVEIIEILGVTAVDTARSEVHTVLERTDAPE